MRKVIFLALIILALGVLVSCQVQPASPPQKSATEPGLAPLPLQENPVLAPPAQDRYRLLRPVLDSVRDYFRRH